MTASLLSPFAEQLPRLYELKALPTNQQHPRNYFQKLESDLAKGRTVLDKYLRVERWLGALDVDAWADFKERVPEVVTLYEPGRGWRALSDLLDEARGFGYLKSISCTNVYFVKRSKKRSERTPDLGALRDGRLVFCEVKTINESDMEAARRALIYSGHPMASNTPFAVTPEYLRKVSDRLQSAVVQLDAVDPERLAHRVVFTVLRFDDWVGDYQTEYLAQLDAHLLANPVAGADLVFNPSSDLFERQFAMRSATIYRD